jgi:replicative DNA helicase
MTGIAVHGSAAEPAEAFAGSRSALDALAELRLAGLGAGRAPVPTGFEPLDEVLGGGLRPSDLTVIGGKPGLGKTIAALQWARHMATAGATCIFACYEHDEATLLARMLTSDLAEAATAARCHDEARLEGLRRALRAVAAGDVGLRQVLDWDPLLAEAEDRFAASAERLVLARASGTRTDVAELRRAVEEHGSGQTVLFVDYLQKVPITPDPGTEAERVRKVADALKELGLGHRVAVVALTAADQSGLDARRVRVQHFRGASSLAYEADVAIVLNAKLDIVSRAHLAYDTRTGEFRGCTVFTVEKNRHGAGDVDLEFRKDFANYRFDPSGRFVGERLWAQGSLEE